ncbi:hypothetical protein GCWU000341_02061 [Oribacterium sp. oral taxon 078 str. F0262]|nr:hypothetical protein GCWU000341_02061 [Oribacterium sp. oral taxon 078 str. F0262]
MADFYAYAPLAAAAGARTSCVKRANGGSKHSYLILRPNLEYRAQRKKGGQWPPENLIPEKPEKAFPF